MTRRANAARAFLLAAACLAARPAAAEPAVEPVPVTEDWYQKDGASADPKDHVQEVFYDLAGYAGLGDDPPVLVWRDEAMLETGCPAGLQAHPDAQGGVMVFCDGAPDYGYRICKGASPAVANMCRDADRSVFGIVALSDAVLDLGQPCDAGKTRITKEEALAWVLAHELAHIAAKDPWATAVYQTKTCGEWLSKPGPEHETVCAKLPGCEDRSKQILAMPEAQARVERTRLGLELCRLHFESDWAERARKDEAAADRNAANLMRLYAAGEGLDLDERAGLCALSRIRELEAMGLIPTSADTKAATHPTTEFRLKLLSEALDQAPKGP